MFFCSAPLAAPKSPLNFNFPFSNFLSPPDCATVAAVSLNRTQILGALILAALALLLFRWKFAH